MAECKESFFILSCMDRDEAFTVPYAWLQNNKKNLNTTERGENVPLATLQSGGLAINMSKVGDKADVDPYKYEILK